MRSVGPDFVSTQFYTRVRVKSHDSIVKKIYAKRREPEGELFSFYDLTDLVGLRIVTLYDDEIEKAVEHLLKLIEDSSNLDEPLFKPFKPPRPNEITLWDYIRDASFIRRVRDDETKDIYEQVYDGVVARLEEMISDPDTLSHHKKKLKLRKPAKEGYSSIHFVLNGVSKLRNKEYEIPIEVQIRTAAEDIWSEINHQLLYKVQDLFVWTPRIQQLYADMEDDSRSVKRKLYELRYPIARFWDHSKEAGRLIKNFREPTTPYHRSLIVTLFYAISGEYFDNVDQVLKTYDNTLLALTKTTDSREAANTLFTCVTLVKEVRDKFEASRKKVLVRLKKGEKDERRALENDSILLNQRQLLCDLEIARLEALAVVRFKHVIDSPTRKIEAGQEKAEIRRVFDVMCEIRNSWDLTIRPVAMMSFWKYIIGREIDHHLGIYHLRAAADEIEQDSSLPNWSIYRILIPRYLAAELYAEAQKLVHDNGRRPSREIWWRSHVAIDARSMLTRAFELALQSYAKHLKRDHRSGDLVFGYEIDEGIRDADVIANVTSLYVTLFDSPDYEGLGTNAQFIADRVREVHAFHKTIGSPDDRVKRKIGRLEQLLAVLC